MHSLNSTMFVLEIEKLSTHTGVHISKLMYGVSNHCLRLWWTRESLEKVSNLETTNIDQNEWQWTIHLDFQWQNEQSRRIQVRLQWSYQSRDRTDWLSNRPRFSIEIEKMDLTMFHWQQDSCHFRPPWKLKHRNPENSIECSPFFSNFELRSSLKNFITNLFCFHSSIRIDENWFTSCSYGSWVSSIRMMKLTIYSQFRRCRQRTNQNKRRPWTWIILTHRQSKKMVVMDWWWE